MPALDRLILKGFKSIKELDLKLRPINVLIGQNGAGKSNFVSFFRMLNALIEQRLQEYVGKSGGANALLHYGQKTTKEIAVGLYFEKDGWFFRLIPSEEDTTLLHYGQIDDIIASRIHNWKIYHFHDTSSSALIKKTGNLYDNEFLRPNAENLAAFLYLLQIKHPKHYALIRSAIQRVFPRFGDFLLRPDPFNEEAIRLEWKEKGSDYHFGPHQISDGTLRFMALATLLLQPNLPSTVLIDEPELGLHPAALSVLGGLVRSAATRTQVILTTQSVTFLNEFEPEDVITVDREKGASVFQRHTTDDLAAWLEDYSLAEIWEKNIIGGRP